MAAGHLSERTVPHFSERTRSGLSLGNGDALTWSDSVPVELAAPSGGQPLGPTDSMPSQHRLSSGTRGRQESQEAMTFASEDPKRFANLLVQLNDQHETEMAALQEEVSRLKERLGGDGTIASAVSSHHPGSVAAWLNGPSPSLMSLLDGQPKGMIGLPTNTTSLRPTLGARQISDVEGHMYAQQEAAHMRRETSKESTVVQRWELLPQWSDHSKITPARTRLASIFEYVEADIKYRKKSSTKSKEDSPRSPTAKKRMARPWRFVAPKDPDLDLSNQCPIIHPSSTLKEMWDFFGLIVLAIDAVWIPLQVFDINQALGTKLLNICITVFWTLDMYVSFVAGYYDQHGDLVMKFVPIAKRYMRSWFPLDCIILGSDWYMIISSAISGEKASGAGDSVGLARLGKMMRFARILRALRLVRLLKIRQLLYRLQESISSERFAILCGVCNNVVLVAALQHYTACVWYWIGSARSDGATWVKEYLEPTSSFAERYLLSLHWCLAQFTPAPLGVTPQNEAERAFNVILIFLSLIVFSSFMSSITTSMVRLKSLGSEYTVQVFMLRKFLKDNHISTELAARVSRYIDLAVDMHKKRTDRSQVQLLHLLSGPLNIMLQREVFEPHLLRHVLFQEFKKVSSAALSQLCFSAMSEALVSKSDVLFMAGSLSYSMWFLDSGSMVYRCMKHLKGRVRRSSRVPTGTSICEAVLWVEWFHHGTMISLIESDLVKLDAQKFREIAMDNPSAMAFACRYAAEFIAKSREHTLTDIPYELAAIRRGKGKRDAGASGVEVTSAELVEAQLVSLAAASTSDSDDSELESMHDGSESASSEPGMLDVVP